MPTAKNPSTEDRQLARARAIEWRTFRKTYLYNQSHLAHALHCSRRAVSAIESGREVFNPNFDLLRRFRTLKKRQMTINGPPRELTASNGHFQQRSA